MFNQENIKNTSDIELEIKEKIKRGRTNLKNDLKIERFETTPKGLKASLVENKPGQEFEVTLSWDGPVEKKLIYGIPVRVIRLMK